MGSETTLHVFRKLHKSSSCLSIRMAKTLRIDLCYVFLGIKCNYWILQTGYSILALFPQKCSLFHDFYLYPFQ